MVKNRRAIRLRAQVQLGVRRHIRRDECHPKCRLGRGSRNQRKMPGTIHITKRLRAETNTLLNLSISRRGIFCTVRSYSEYIHFVFAGPHSETEEALGHKDANRPFGCIEYFASGQKGDAPMSPLVGDIEAASFTLELSWPLLMLLDPFMNITSAAFREELIQQGMVFDISGLML